MFPVRSRETNPNSGKITQVQPLDATVAYRSARGGPVDDLEIAHKVFVSDEHLGSTGGELGGLLLEPLLAIVADVGREHGTKVCRC